MKNAAIKIFPIFLFPVSLFFSSPSFAQITPDTTLGTESSVVTPNVTIGGQKSDRIDGGAIRGTNLFHSFKDFNIDAGRGAYFTNPDGVSNILTRVTGTNPSKILGTLGVLGNANLFLLNPNGIVFGASASLNLNGSFLGSSAHSVNFADGTTFSATNPQAAPLLTVSVPVGLGFGSNPGAIQVQGTGHSIANLLLGDTSLTGLRVQPGRTLALVGGDVAIEGGTLKAPQGRIELGSVGSGQVSLSPTASGWNLGYEGVESFQDIRLSQKALLDAGGFPGGSIQVQGASASIADGSAIIIQNLGTQPAGAISIHAAESVKLSGLSQDVFPSLVYNFTLGAGNGGDIAVSTNRLVVEEGGQIATLTLSDATGGNITVNAKESVQVIRNGIAGSIIVTQTNGSGHAGNLTLSTGRLAVLGGAALSSFTTGTGLGGNVTVNATDSVEVIGAAAVPGSFSPSIVSSTTFGDGKAGSLTINTSSLAVRDGGWVDSSTFASGDAGSVTINASESVEVSGTVPGSRNPSLVISSANILAEELRLTLGLPPLTLSGASGDMTINTPTLRVTDGGLISVKNEGSGNAGTTKVNAGSIVLDTQGGITAATASGSGGDIFLQAQNLELRDNSAIAATAGKSGNGGNLSIDTGTLLALEDSDITADAYQGNGGNILIGTQGIFRSADSDITADSQLGISGVVKVTEFSLEQQNALVAPESNFVDTQQVVAGSCLARRTGSQGVFVVTGNGGLPENPLDAIALPYELVQVQPVESRESAVENRESSHSSLPNPRAWKLGDPIQPAGDLVVTADNRTLLVEASTSGAVANPQDLTCQLPQPQPVTATNSRRTE